MGKKGDFEHGVIVGSRQSNLETAELLGFSSGTLSSVYREQSEQEEISSEWQQLPQSDRKTKLTQITSCYNLGIP